MKDDAPHPKDAPPPDFRDLRRRAEEQLEAEALPPEELSAAEAARLIHELRVHRIELEMQNEELRLSQARLEESRSKYADLYDFAPVSYLTLNQEDRIVEANLTAATQLGLARSRLLGRFFPLFLVKSHRPVFRQWLQNASNQPEPRGEFQLLDGQGETRTMLVNLLLLRDAGGREQYRLCLTDITELKKAQRALEEYQEELHRLNETLEQRVKERTKELELSNRELESFSYSVSHDLKSPLRAIQGFSRMLLEEHAAGLDAESRRLLQVVVDNTRLMDRLIDDLLNLARLAHQQMRKMSLDLTSMARGVFTRLQSQEPGRDLRLVVAAAPPAWGDYNLLQQVLLNLLENAVKFTRTKETAVIEVGGRTEGEETIYYIKDNGVGFDENYAHKLFMVFRRLHPCREFTGSGVGLATVQRIIQRHGGRVWAEGKVGEGATIYFTLPPPPQDLPPAGE